MDVDAEALHLFGTFGVKGLADLVELEASADLVVLTVDCNPSTQFQLAV